MDEQTIFTQAAALTTPRERAEFLDFSCGGDKNLRERVENLLRLHDDAGSFLENTPQELDEERATVVSDKSAQKRLDSVTLSDETYLRFLAQSDRTDSLGRLGHYEILSVLGRGGMGIVFKAHDTRLTRTVAIKMLAPELAADAMARKRFLREARAAAAVTHPHVVTIYAVEEERIPFLAMECIDGQTLRDKIERQGMLDVSSIVRIGSQMAQGLAAAHKQGLIHRDIKPANILLENGIERVKITDFGLARAADDFGVTRTGEVAGTPQFMSPEQAQGQPVDPRSDLFSLGSVMYAMCTGRSPFRAETPLAAIRRVCDDTPRPIREINPDVPDWLSALIMKLLSKKPEQRPQTAADVAEILGDHLAHAKPMPHRQLRRNRGGLEKLRWPAAIAAVVLLLMIGYFVIRWGVSNIGGPDPIRPNNNGVTNVGPPQSMPPEVASHGSRPVPVTDQLKDLIPAAAAIPEHQWLILSGDERGPDTSIIEGEPLSLALLKLNPSDEVKKNANVKKEFWYLTAALPTPSSLSQALRPGGGFAAAKGDATFIRREYITEISWDEQENVGYGKVSFAVPNLYAGTISFVAKRIRGNWSVSAFHLPQYGFKVELDDQGVWRRHEIAQTSGDAPEWEIPPSRNVLAEQLDAANKLGVPETFTNKMGMKFKLIPAGEFEMGLAPREVHDALKHVEETGSDPFTKFAVQTSGPRHQVRITQPFYIGAYEVTNAQFQAFVDIAGYQSTLENNDQALFTWKKFATGDDAGERPVIGVSYADATAFCEWLSKTDGIQCQLPSEAQWEYACRGGSGWLWSFGSNPNEADAYAVIPPRSNLVPSRVGSKQPNMFGLYDMHGNADEWCRDWHDRSFFSAKLMIDPVNLNVGTDPASGRVVRGGSWDAGHLLWTYAGTRGYDFPERPVHHHGFRVVITGDLKAATSLLPIE